MILSFELSMPNVGSWNGKWSGEGRLYAIIKTFSNSKKQTDKAKAILKENYYYYSFGDGWSAGIHVRKVDLPEARKLRRKTQGFCGYDWMVNSIISHGGIMTQEQRLAAEAK